MRETCRWCGGAGASETCPLSVACSTCGRPAGKRCKRPSGHTCTPHAPRMKIADQAVEALRGSPDAQGPPGLF